MHMYMYTPIHLPTRLYRHVDTDMLAARERKPPVCKTSTCNQEADVCCSWAELPEYAVTNFIRSSRIKPASTVRVTGAMERQSVQRRSLHGCEQDFRLSSQGC